ncbi:hypothetical protein Mkiyose1088_51590 [Mycobacterium kiyosense]|nr:hypothetical protein Mkiyose1088_51590 [Mycobacterium kiyosense]
MINTAPGPVLITGSGFLPGRSVTLRIFTTGEDVVDYLTYTADPNGHLSAALHEAVIAGEAQITATDHRLDPYGDGGLLWSNAVVIAHPGLTQG